MMLLVSLAVLCGCAADDAPPLRNQTVAGDFSLSVHVAGDGHDPEPMRRRAQFVVQPDRMLRLATGPAASPDTFPRPYRRLSPAEFASLYELVARNHLLAEPTSPIAAGSEADDQAVILRVAITAGGRTNRYATTAAESPPTAALLARLVALIEKETW